MESARSYLNAIQSPWLNSRLVLTLARREIEQRYRGSVAGIGWALLQPLALLLLLTTVFGVLLKSKWSSDTSTLDFALFLFVGLIFYNFAVECLQQAPTLVTSNPNYVKKIVFPLEVLPWVSVLVAGFQAAVSLLILFVATFFIRGSFHVVWTFIPLLFVPAILLCLAFGWFFSALGVYIRDSRQIVALLSPALMFFTPIFYSISNIPKEFQALVLLNPLTGMVEGGRQMLFEGVVPDFTTLGSLTAVSLAAALVSLAWFQRLRHGFADAL